MPSRIDSFKMLVLIYVIASCLTHFSVVPNVLSWDMRRHGIFIALREGAFNLMVLIAAMNLLKRSLSGREGNHVPILLIFLAIILYPMFLTVVLSENTSLTNIVVAGRVVLSTLAIFLLPVEMSRRDDRVVFLRNLLLCLLPFEALLATLQIKEMAPYYGATFLGARAVGSFASPLHLSFFAGAVAIVLAVRPPPQFMKAAMFLCAYLCLTSGGRGGMILFVIALLYRFYIATKKTRANMLIFAASAVILIFLAYLSVSTEALSGRAGTSGGLESEARWGTWALALARNFDGASLAQWVLGVGLGTGSNTAASVVTDGARNISDSTFIFTLQSYGILGLVLFTFAAAFFWRGVAKLHYSALIGWAVVANTQVMIELHPANFVLLSALLPVSSLVGWKHDRRQMPAGREGSLDLISDARL